MNTQFITLGTQIDRFTSDTVDTQFNKTIRQFQIETGFSILSTLAFGGEKELNFEFDVSSIDSTTTVGTPQLTRLIVLPSITSTLLFGDTEDLSFAFAVPSIPSSVAFGNTTVFVSIGPAPTVTVNLFGLPSIPRVVHRSLIFKDDNISKLGGDDDVEIASGIVVHSGTQTFTGNTTPESTAGFILVTINGVDYKMPFFNL